MIGLNSKMMELLSSKLEFGVKHLRDRRQRAPRQANKFVMLTTLGEK
jgi:hypothetical protein